MLPWLPLGLLLGSLPALNIKADCKRNSLLQERSENELFWPRRCLLPSLPWDYFLGDHWSGVLEKSTRMADGLTVPPWKLSTPGASLLGTWESAVRRSYRWHSQIAPSGPIFHISSFISQANSGLVCQGSGPGIPFYFIWTEVTSDLVIRGWSCLCSPFGLDVRTYEMCFFSWLLRKPNLALNQMHVSPSVPS